MVREDHLMVYLTGRFLVRRKARENLRETKTGVKKRPVLLLSNPRSLQPIQEICPRSAMDEPYDDDNAYRHDPHPHNQEHARLENVDPEPSCALNKPGWAGEPFSADSDELFAGPPEYSCQEPDGSGLLGHLKRIGWIDGS